MNDSIHFLIELRKRLLRVILVLGVFVAALSMYADKIYHFLALPLIQNLAKDASLIAISVPAPFLVPFKSALTAALFITIPYLLYQLWAFIAPALYRQERRLLWLILLTSVVLFYSGVAFSYFIVLPLVFKFFIYIAPKGVEVKPDITQFFSFIMRMFFAFGFSFELPIAILLIVWTGITTPEKLARKRPYVIVGAFAAGMLLTPPDIISQLLLAFPLWLLFEFGLILSRFIVKKPMIQTGSTS